MDHENLVELYELTKKKRVNVYALSAEHEPLRMKILSKRMICIDGLSRGAELCENELLLKSRSGSNVMVRMYARKDEIPMEGHDAILIGSVLNFYSGSSSRLTTCDAVNIVNAYLRLLKASLFPNGYPEAIENNSSLKNRIVRL